MRKLFRKSKDARNDPPLQQAAASHSYPQQPQSYHQPSQQPHQQPYQQPYQQYGAPQSPGHGPQNLPTQFAGLSITQSQLPPPVQHQPYYPPQAPTSLSPQPSVSQNRQRSTSGGEDIARFLVEQGDGLVAANDFAGAVTTYTLAIQSNPTNPDLLLKRGYAYRMMQPPKLPEALMDTQTACRNNPYDWNVWSQLGQIHLQNKDPHFAVEALEKAVELGGAQVTYGTKSALDNARAIAQAEPSGVQPSIQVTQPATSAPQVIASSAPQSEKASFQASSLNPPASTLNPASSSQQPPAPPRSPNPAAQSVRPTPPATILPMAAEVAPQGTPPTYAPNATSTDPAVRALSQQALTAQLAEFQTTMAGRLRGCATVKAYSSADKIDAVKLLYTGLEQKDLTDRELGTPHFAHPSFQRIYASTVDFPGTTWLDMDPETSVIYDGGAPGTLSISGYSEEYRQQQYAATPRLILKLQQQTPLPPVTTDFLVKRIQSLKYPTTHPRTDASLKQVLGNSTFLTGANDLQDQISAICYTLNRDIPEFATYTKAGRNTTNNVFGNATQGVGLKNWLHQIVLGSELLLRLRAETRVLSYAGLMTDEISALLFICNAFMQDVEIRVKPEKTGLDDPARYSVVAQQHVRQSAGLIRLGELLRWPYMDEARDYCENAFSGIMAGTYTPFDIYDWYFSLFRPGYHFRFQIMSCLRYATPKIRDLGGAAYYDSGIVVADKSYWPRRVVLGRVLGGCKSVKMVCGWVGPFPRPSGIANAVLKKDGQDVEMDGAYVELTARALTCPIPCAATDANAGMEYQYPHEDESTYLSHLVNPDTWQNATGPTLGSSTREPIKLKGISLTNVAPPAPAGSTNPLAGRPSYRAAVTFDVGSKELKFTLFSNPFFVWASPCIGEHPLYERNITKLNKSTFHVSKLKDVYSELNTVIVIDALSADDNGDEEAMARAWCSERGLNAIVRRGNGCCFSCAVTFATQRLGLGFNVLICS